METFEFTFQMSNYYSDIDDSDSDYDTELEDEIDADESLYGDEERVDGGYYIGVSDLVQEGGADGDWIYLLGYALTKNSFFKYPFDVIRRYMNYYSILYPVPECTTRNVDIVQLIIRNDNVYSVVIKTFWLKLIQRSWKRVLRERTEITRRRMNPAARHILEMTGKYPMGLRNFPGLAGMMSHTQT